METLKLLHDLHFNTPLGIFFSTPFVASAFILFLWSFGPAIKKEIQFGFLIWLRLVWTLILIPIATGVILAVDGSKVPSATNFSSGFTKYGYLVDSKRDWERWMYAAFCLLSLYIIEALVKGRFIKHESGLRFLPLITLFLYGCAFMTVRVAVFPGDKSS